MNRIYPITVASGLTGKEGTFFKIVNGVPTPVAAATDAPSGCLDHYLSDTKGGLALEGAATRVKVSAAVKQFSFGKLDAAGTASAFAGAEGEVRVCQFLQDGVADEFVNAIIIL